MKRKKFKELTFKDNFMFGAVMIDEENCRKFLEMTLGFPISKVEVAKEKSIIYHPEYKSVRLDIYAKDEQNTHYNVEMQVIQKDNLAKRSRYYHSQIDMELLLAGLEYEKLPKSYVIFICDFDPFGREKYCYTFEMRCSENAKIELKDGSWTIFLSTCGKNDNEVPETLVKFLKFVKADLEESEKDFEDEFVKQIQESIRRVKSNREMEGRHMLFEELLRDERKEGRIEGRAEMLVELLQDLGEVPENLRKKIMAQRDSQILREWAKKALIFSSIEEFEKNM